MRSFLRNRQLIYLALSSLSILFIGNGLYPLLPYIAGRLGASHAEVGLIFAAMNLANATGKYLAGWSGRHVPRKPLFVGSAALGIPAVYLLNHVGATWHLVALVSYLWFAGGFNLALIQVYTGMHAAKSSRGVAFGIMQLAMPLSTLLAGGAAAGLLPVFGYTGFFGLLFVVWFAVPLLGLRIREGADGPRQDRAPTTGGPVPSSVLVFLSASLLAGLALSIMRLGIALSMQTEALAEPDVMWAGMVGAALAVPAALGSGALSDRVGRKIVLAASLALLGICALWLPAARQPWHFAMGYATILAAMGNVQSLIAALATDTLDASMIGRVLPWTAAAWTAAGIASSAATGYLMQGLGAGLVFGAAAGFSVLAIVFGLLLPGPLPRLTLRRPTLTPKPI